MESPPRRDGRTVAVVWREIRRVYDANRRDLSHAYGGADMLVRLNAMYEQSSSSLCRIVLMTHSEHSSLLFYLGHAERLARLHGVIVFSMCFFRRADNADAVIDREERQRLHALMTDMYRSPTTTLTDSVDDNDDDESFESSIADASKFPLFEQPRENDFRYGSARLFANEDETMTAGEDEEAMTASEDDDDARKKRRCEATTTGSEATGGEDDARKKRRSEAATTTAGEDDARERSEAATGREKMRKILGDFAISDPSAKDVGDSSGDIFYSSKVDVVKAVYRLHERDDRSCNLRNRILLEFFGKFIYYAREFVICDHTGMPFHKSFRLIDQHTVKQLCLDSIRRE